MMQRELSATVEYEWDIVFIQIEAVYMVSMTDFGKYTLNENKDVFFNIWTDKNQ